MNDAEARTLLAAAVPANVREVCRAIAGTGHEAVTVGGAVRDVLLGRTPGDWDIATSAPPGEVMQLFRHTIPTGLQHGTVTVVTGKGAHVEVTTFRGEGAYSDARRPDHVVFGVPLVEDLARRDLVVNAMAYDPSADRLIDPFGGRADIAARQLRAVGDPVARFTEDGLRVMRAVRFAAQLEFELDPVTEAGIPPALPSLAKVSRERVSDELRKLLATRQPSRGLRIAKRTGIIETILKHLDVRIHDVEAWLARIDRAPVDVRLAALFVPIGERAAVIELAKALKFSNAESELAGTIVGGMTALDDAAWTLFAARKQFSEMGLAAAHALLALWAACEPIPFHKSIGDQVIHDPLMVKDLAVTGGELMKALDMKPGPMIGRIIHVLHLYVLEEPSRNTRETLLRRAQELELEIGR